MSVLILLIPISLIMASIFVALCVTSIRSGQFDDLESPRWRVLFEGTPLNGKEEASAEAIAHQGNNNGEIG
jgi:cbb3-type cytochrome oxidase maturation protein